jgi:pimeloyl-ACP methyl ester carboxylesterase
MTARADLGGFELAYELRGEGEPVVLLHWGVGAAWAGPLARRLERGYRVLAYDRAGFGASGRPPGTLTIADHARHCGRLLEQVGISRAHVVGHSSSAAIALQLALDAPEKVRTLALMEPARPAPDTAVQAEFAREHVEPAVALYRAGDKTAAVEAWLDGVFGEGWRPVLDAGLPGSFAQAIADADAFFGDELPALRQWTFTAQDASRIRQPVLLVLGSESVPTFPERCALLRSWLPRAETFVARGVNHMLHAQDPDLIARGLEAFYRIPISDLSPTMNR